MIDQLDEAIVDDPQPLDEDSNLSIDESMNIDENCNLNEEIKMTIQNESVETISQAL